jgi:hypothetical protein
MRRSLFVSLTAAVLALGGASVSADHSWGGYHWPRTTDTLTLQVGDNVSTKWDSYLDEAISDWNASPYSPPVLNLTEVLGGTNPKRCRPTAGRIEACSERYGRTGWLGIAQIWLSGGHITQAITKVNDTYFDTATYDTPAWRRLVMCQEIAHDFGLDHQDENFDNDNLGSCMDYTRDPDGPPSNEHPNAHDYEQIDLIYNHLEATAGGGGVNRMPPGLNEDLDTPAQWGRLIRSNANGRVQVYERDLGRGNRLITHVFWADPAADAR